MLAIAMLNCGRDAAWLSETALYELSIYTFALSPRYDDLVVISNAAGNIGNRLLPARGKREDLCLPGMRLVEYTSDSMRLLHVPSGARMTTTRNPADQGRTNPVPDDWWWRADKPLTSREEEALASLPSLTPDAETLLAALLVRFCVKDPAGAWDIGMWFNDRVGIPRSEKRTEGHARRLDGQADQWELRWTSLPFPQDLVAALTHPRAGLPGVRVIPAQSACEIRFGSAVLTLRP
ncbi:hypothetical protein ACWGFX_36675 [Streptomyces xanthophaeus]